MLVVIYWQILIGAVAFVPLACSGYSRWQAPSLGSVSLVAYLAVLCSVGAFLLYGYGLRGLRSSSAVNLLNLVPVFGLAVSVALLHESVQPIQIIGGAVVIVGVVLGLQHQEEHSPEAGSGVAANETRRTWITRTQRSSA